MSAMVLSRDGLVFCGRNARLGRISQNCGPSFFWRLGKRTTGRFGRMSRWHGFVAMEPASREDIRSIRILCSRNVSIRSSSCNRPLPAGVATVSLRHCRLAQIQNLHWTRTVFRRRLQVYKSVDTLMSCAAITSMRCGRPQNGIACHHSWWFNDQHRNPPRRGNRRGHSIRKGAAGHDNQPLLNLVEGQGTGRGIG